MKDPTDKKSRELATANRIGYARISTSDQSLDLQRDALTRAGCARIFEDTISGVRVRQEREGLAAAFDYARRGDVLVIWRLDRLGRSLPELVKLANELAERGIELESLHEKIDTSTPTGRLTFHLFAALAEFERELIRERTTAGLAASRARGRRGGRKPLDTDKIAAARAAMADTQQSPSAIARALGISRSALYKYAGDVKGVR